MAAGGPIGRAADRAAGDMIGGGRFGAASLRAERHSATTSRATAMARSDLDSRSAIPSTISALLATRAERQPNDLAFAFLSDATAVKEQVTYSELDRAARRIARLLREESVHAEPVLLLYGPSLEYVSAFFGCLYAGAIAVPAYPPHRNRSLERLRAIVRDSGARTVLCSRAVHDSLERALTEAPDLQGLHWIATDSVGDSTDGYCDLSSTPDTLAFLQYTSGSTSTPKGVMLSHGNLCHNAQLITKGFHLGHESTAVFWLPLYHDMGLIGGVLQPMQIGRPSYLMAPATFLSRPMRWLQAISHFRARISGAPNFAYDLCANKVTPEQLADLDLSTWRVAFNGAEPVRAETLEKFARTFAPCGFRARAAYPCYGLAESTLIVTGGGHDHPPVTLTISRPALEQHRIELVAGDHAEARTVVGCGSPLLDQRVAIVDPETFEICPADRPGEIWIAGPSVAQGYWRRPDLSAATFAARTADGDGPFLRTGDLGFMHGGELFVTGRIKDLIILRGRNHYPQDIEQTIEHSHSSIRAACCAAFSIEQDGGERLIVVAEVERSGRKVPVHKVATAVRQAVAEHHDVMVDTLVLLKPGSVPKTSSGKIQRHACKDGFLANTLSIVGRWDADAPVAAPAVPVQPSSVSAGAIRAFLIERIAQRLRLAPSALDSRQPLAGFGLDSLSAVQLAGELEEWLQRPLSPVLIYDYPSIDALALHLAGVDQSADGDSGLVDQNKSEIAVIGIGCRFPGADGVDGYWKLLSEGVDAITEVPADRWNADEYYSQDPTAAGKMTTRRGGFIKAVDQFDRAYFGISPREAARMDPQQRHLLEVSAEALDDAGQDVDRLAGQPVGVFVGIASNDYGRLQMGDLADLDAYVGTGNAMSIAANRLSFTFDFRGPSMAVDTACSSSLVAIHLACQSLRRGESKLAIAAGVNLILTPDLTINFSRANMMAPDGRCKAFDAAADGYVRSEGVGVVILKPLAQAVADGDRIYAVVRGSAVTQDGRSNGLTAPNRQAQEAVLRAAYADAGVSPGAVDAIEAHGTGTALGDPIEALAIGHVLATDRPAESRAWVGSVKTNIGHLEAAAGVAGFIKMALALHHGELPGSLHFHKPNPHIPFSDLPIRIATEGQMLPGDRPAIVGVSSFGFGGTNAHIVLQAMQSATSDAEPANGSHLISISARSGAALSKSVERWLERQDRDGHATADVAYTAARRRTHHDHRIAIVARDRFSLRDQLKAHLEGAPRAGLSAGRRVVNREPRIAFVFSGQGSQWWGMGRRLLETEAVFRAAVERCDAVFRPLAGWSIVELVLTQNDGNRLDDTDVVQPAIFAIQYGLAELLGSWGISPSAVVGHSLGEVAAACVAGALDLADGVRVVMHRARLQHSIRGKGRMAAVGLSAEESESALRGFESLVSVAAINGPRATVWSGDPSALEAALQQLRDRDVFHRLLRGQVAFHSPQMDEIRGKFVTALNGFRPRGGNVKYVSTVTGRLETGESLTSEYWSRNLREPVAFAAAIETLMDAEIDAFLEIGPHPTLVDSIQQTLKSRNRSAAVVGTLRRDEDERTCLLSAVGALYVIGSPIAWERIEPQGRHVSLPGYPWQRERCWHAVAPAARPITKAAESAPTPMPREQWLVRSIWEAVDQPAAAGTLAGNWLVIGDKPVVLDRTVESLRARGAAVIPVLVAGPNSRPAADRKTIDPNDPAQWRKLLHDVSPAGVSLRGIVFAGGMSAPTADGLTVDALAAAQDRSCAALMHLVQAAVNYGVSARLWIVTRGTQAARETDAPAVAAAPMWGFGRVLAHEHPELRPTLIDLDPSPRANDFRLLADVIAAEPEIDQWALRAGKTLAVRLVPGAGAIQDGPLPIQADATYLVTGGLGGLGLAVARWLVDRGARSLVLTSRRGPTSESEKALADLRQRGAAVTTPSVDVADHGQMSELIDTIDSTMPPLRGLFHLAGVLEDGIILHQNRERLSKVLQPKVQGAWNLHTLTADRQLDVFALFSSAASLLGSPGQSNYAAANAFLDALASYRRARGLQAVSINWGPWAEVGMAARDSREAKLAGAGMSSIGVEDGLAILGRALTAGVTQLGVIPVDPRAWKRFAPNGQAPYYLSALAGESDETTSAAPAAPVTSALDRAALLAVSTDEWPAILEHQLRAQTARVLKLAVESLDVEQPLNNVGIDSLMAIELKNRIEADLGATVPMVKFLEGPSVRDLAGYLSEQLIPALAPRRAAAAKRNGKHKTNGLAGRNAHAAPTPAPINGVATAEPDTIDAGQLLARLDSLSDAEVDSLLSELCDAEKGV